MQKVGILGGTFNPVHAEHVSMAKNAIKELNLDKLLIMPTFISPHKSLEPASPEHRINMLKIAFSGMEKVEICDYEILKGGTSFTYQTVEQFKTSNNQLFFICGGDMLVDFKNWKYPERILNSASLAVFEREGFFADFDREKEYFRQAFGKEFIRLKYVGKQVSSTKIRIYSAFGFNIEDSSIKGVSEYIENHGLYCESKLVEFLKNHLTEKRLLHTANVAITAMQKVRQLGLDAKKVLTACLLHDVAKYMSPEDFKDFQPPEDIPQPVMHSYLGAFVAEKILGIKDEDILNAIRYHTAGRENMSTLEKLVFVADMIEEGRTYAGVESLREYYKRDLDTCFKECLKEEYLHLKNKGQAIFIETINAYNYYVKGE